MTIYLTILALGSSHDQENLAVAKLISNWFDKNAGRALGIAAVGISFSGVALPLVVDPLLELSGLEKCLCDLCLSCPFYYFAAYLLLL